MLKQFKYFISDYKRFSAGSYLKGLYVWMNWGVIGIFFYRLERSLFLLVGRKTYRIIRVLLFPLLSIIQALSHIDISYLADIGPGVCVLHYSQGVVIAQNVVVGKNLTLSGGNIIGRKKNFEIGEYVVGDNVEMGVNSVIMGPVIIGDNVKIGALACVVRNSESSVTLVGVPAHEV